MIIENRAVTTLKDAQLLIFGNFVITAHAGSALQNFEKNGCNDRTDGPTGFNMHANQFTGYATKQNRTTLIDKFHGEFFIKDNDRIDRTGHKDVEPTPTGQWP